MTDDDQDLLERIEGLLANAWDDDEHETLSEARDRIQDLITENERLKYNGIHSCHDQCERPLCVLERENEKLREALQSVMPPAYFGESEQNKAWWAKARAALGETK